MAISLSPEINARRGRDTIRISPRNLIVDPKKRGREFPPGVGKVRQLADDIKANGQTHPISVAKTPDKKLEVIAGFTRHEAYMLLDTEDPEAGYLIECLVREGNAEELFIANINENFINNKPSTVDDAFNIRRLQRDFGKTDAEVLAIYGGKSQAWLDHTIKPLLTLPREIQKQIHYGELDAAPALVLAKLNVSDEKRLEILEQSKDAKGKVTSTAVLKKARESGSLSKATGMKMTEVKTAFTYLLEDKNPKVSKLAKTYLDFTSGKITEPDFFRSLHRMFA